MSIFFGLPGTRRDLQGSLKKGLENVMHAHYSPYIPLQGGPLGLSLMSSSVRDLGVTHLQLAKHLRNILEQTEATKRKANKGPDHEITLKYLAADIPHAKEQTLTVGHRFFCGDQWSLFYNPDVSDNESEKWREDHFVSNSWGLSVCLAGGLKGGILNYIENYGFYEGGVENEYRVDPNILYALLSGVLLPEVVQIQMLRVNSRITVLQEEIDHTNFELQNYLKQDADPKEAQKVILSHYHSILNTKLQNMNQLQQQLLYWNSHTTSK
eukprot:TRINITY_DN1456_c0_g1_i3.p1 TRINITY_DN1456_c0_g1~~TRINITY_DN1456_c0_g1_i3.p1  ORF type:complete len:268 (+),score=38.14 TRINITY_DN1456_c0_g1_i3:145-948(+)